jgi:regulatory protein
MPDSPDAGLIAALREQIAGIEAPAFEEDRDGASPIPSNPAVGPRPARGASDAPTDTPLGASEPHARALALAYRLVGQRERCEADLRARLLKKECSADAIDAAVAELVRFGFLDDRRYARMYAEDKRRLQGWGDRRIRLQLGRAGVPRGVVDELFTGEEALDAPSELEAALELLHRKQPDLADQKARTKAASMLARRGIASPVVWQALREHAKREAADA